MLEGEEDGVAEPRPSDESHRNEAVPRRTLVDVQHQTGVKHLRQNNVFRINTTVENGYIPSVMIVY